jgi:hypothetical protein
MPHEAAPAFQKQIEELVNGCLRYTAASANAEPPKLATTRALRALLPRERWTASQWAENCRVLSDEESSEPGPYNFDRTPYWRFVLDARGL